jgi:hypothetical protein
MVNFWYPVTIPVILQALVTLEFRGFMQFPRTHWISVWVDPRASVNALETRKNVPLPGIESRPSSH